MPNTQPNGKLSDQDELILRLLAQVNREAHQGPWRYAKVVPWGLIVMAVTGLVSLILLYLWFGFSGWLLLTLLSILVVGKLFALVVEEIFPWRLEKSTIALFKTSEIELDKARATKLAMENFGYLAVGPADYGYADVLMEALGWDAYEHALAWERNAKEELVAATMNDNDVSSSFGEFPDDLVDCQGPAPAAQPGTLSTFELPDPHTVATRQHDVTSDGWPGADLSFSQAATSVRAELDMKDRTVFLPTVSGSWVSFDSYQPERFDDWLVDPTKCGCTECAGEVTTLMVYELATSSLGDGDVLARLKQALGSQGYCCMDRTYGGTRGHELFLVLVRLPTSVLQDVPAGGWNWRRDLDRPGANDPGSGHPVADLGGLIAKVLVTPLRARWQLLIDKDRLADKKHLQTLGGGGYCHEFVGGPGLEVPATLAATDSAQVTAGLDVQQSRDVFVLPANSASAPRSASSPSVKVFELGSDDLYRCRQCGYPPYQAMETVYPDCRDLDCCPRCDKPDSA